MSTGEIDPGVQMLLDMINSVEGPPLRDQDLAVARATYAELPFEAEVVEVLDVEDHTIPGHGGDIPVRVYRPSEGRPGVLVWFHGGGWVIGGLGSADRTCRRIATGAGCVVVSVDYRLAPEHRAPSALDDAWTAFEWVQAHAADLGADDERIAVGGDSAGGWLAGAVARRARDEGVALRHQLLAYPVTDPGRTGGSRETNGAGYFLTQDTMEFFEASYFGTPTAADSLLTGDLTGLAPAHVITAGFDPLRDEGQELAEALAGAGVAVTDDRYPTMPHLFLQMGMVTPVAAEGMDRVTKLLAAALE